MNPHEEIPPEIAPRAYYNQPVWKRIVVILAGPAVNILIAFVIVWALLFSNGQTVASTGWRSSRTGTPATEVLQPGDQVISVDGVRGSEDGDPQPARHSSLCRGPGQRLPRRHACARRRQARGQAADVRDPAPLQRVRGPAPGRIRIRLQAGADRRRQAATQTVSGLWSVTKQTVSVVGRIFEPKERKQLSGVVGAYTVTKDSFATSTTTALQVLALISLSLGVINLFPFLPLDGGHVFWALAEKVSGRRIPFEVMERAGVVGFVLILLLFVIGLSNDISTLTGKGFSVK